MSDADNGYTDRISHSVNPTKLAYRGVLIERPCVNCDSVDTHFEGKCNTGPCAFSYGHAVCGIERYVPQTRFMTYIESHGYGFDHKWTPNTYYPEDIEFPKPVEGTFGYALAAYQVERAFNTLVDKAREIGWPEHYTVDLFRDYQRITGRSKYNPVPTTRFAWAVRNTGTDLFTPEVGIHLWYPENYRDSQVFLYDGKTHGPLGDFVNVNWDTARTILGVWRADELRPVQGVAS